MTSLWHDTATLPRFPSLPRGASCDVLVIGGGMAGLLTLHELRRRVRRVAEHVRGRLVDRHCAGIRRGIGLLLAYVQLKGLKSILAHGVFSLSLSFGYEKSPEAVSTPELPWSAVRKRLLPITRPQPP